MANQFEIPILFLIFNRPDTTVKVFKCIREIKPKFLYVAADGPRKFKEGELELTEMTRQIISDIDWECEIKTLYRNENLGCGQSVSSAISWFFENVEMGIILEDDVLPEISFFYFCQELLYKYKDNKQIWHISGNNFINVNTKNSFYFSNYPFIWGWATWRRAWEEYNYRLFNDDDATIKKVIDNTQKNKQSKKFWFKTLLKLKQSHPFFTWDYQWFYTLWKNKGLAILPKYNLVKNIGFGENATHTVESDHKLAKLSTNKIELPLRYQNKLVVKSKIEKKLFYEFYENRISHVKLIFENIQKKFIDGPRRLLKSLFWRLLPETRVLFNKAFAWEYYKNHLENSSISNKAKIYPPYNILDSTVDDYSYIASNSLVVNTKIGKFCSIGPGFRSGWGIHPTEGISTSPMFYSIQRQNGFSFSESNKILEQKGIIIGNDVFIGMNVTILDGVTIGDGVVIGAGAIISGNIPDYAIAVGVPAKVIKYRFKEEIIEKLKRIKWWEFSELDKLKLIEKHFFEIEKFIELCNLDNIDQDL